MTRPITHALPGGVTAVPPHRLVIDELEADRARMLATAANPPAVEIGIACSNAASAYLASIARILHHFEGVNAAQDYLDQHARPLPRSST